MRSVLALLFRLAAALLAIAPDASAQAPQLFDVVARGSIGECAGFVVPGGPTLEFLGISTEDPTDVRFIAPGGEGRVLALVNDPGPTPRTQIVEVRPDLTRRPVSSVSGEFRGSFVADAAGNIYLSTGSRLLAIRPDGTIRADYPLLNDGPMDLAADQCTLFYEGNGIRRFNVCTGMDLPKFLSGIPSGEFRLLPDGGLLRVHSQSEVVRHDAAGTVTRTYSVPDRPEILVLAGGGRTMIVGGSCGKGPFREYDLESGALLRTFSFDRAHIRQLVVYNGFTAALGPLAAADGAAPVPSLTTTMLIALTALLAFIAFRRIG